MPAVQSDQKYRDPEKNGAFNAHELSTIQPGRVYEYTIDFWRATGNVFLPGHKIRIEISSSYFLYYLPKLNTGADNNAYENEASCRAPDCLSHRGIPFPCGASGNPAPLNASGTGYACVPPEATLFQLVFEIVIA